MKDREKKTFEDPLPDTRQNTTKFVLSGFVVVRPWLTVSGSRIVSGSCRGRMLDKNAAAIHRRNFANSIFYAGRLTYNRMSLLSKSLVQKTLTLPRTAPVGKFAGSE